ncbi:SulP family inorganic anion transporter [Candidatus Protochlamydia phocaeensis]|uniref:SulP family inorganic anion transporter n=1 Tax=Candidatus Protochlamydia phocaeensis TaxID=1414722 RepID=UPI0009AD104B|nr:SulP family inorganic anion transporter [Candidatus Protochlamydia phocaeensis]
MSHTAHQDDISLTCFKKDFEKYSWEAFRLDMLSGLSVSMLTVPQAMAYALVAGLPVSCGIFASIFSAIIVAIFGSSRHLIVGPSNAIAILIQGGISSILFTYYRDVTGPEREELVLQILTQLMLLVGAIQILAAFFKLGRLTHFVSHTVIVGYISGVALALIINQTFPLLGMQVPSTVSSLYERSAYILMHLNLADWPTALIGVTCLSILILLRRIDRKMPSGAIMLAIVAVIAYFTGYFFNYFVAHDYQFLDWEKIEALSQNIAVVGDTKGDGLLPHWSWPYFNTGIMNNLLPVAFAVALLSVMESTSASKAIAASSGQRLSTNQEIFGVGMGNFFSSFIAAMPVSGSPSRSSLSYENGAKTRLAAIFHSLFVAVILFAFGFLIRHIPVTAFAALLIVSASNIVNFKQLFLCLKATRSDAFVLVLTILSCIFFSLDIAFYIGVVISISLYLKKAAIPQLVEFTVDESGSLHSIDHLHQHEPRKIRFIKVEGELFFGAADLFQSALKSITEDDTTTRVIILQLKNARDIDATACLALQQLYNYLKSSGRHLIGCGLTHQIWDVLSDSGMIDIMGKNNLFIFDERHPQLSVQKAFMRAHELLRLEGAKAAEMAAAASPTLALTPALPVVQDAHSSPKENLTPALAEGK